MSEEQISKNIKTRYNIRMKKNKLLNIISNIDNFTPYNYYAIINTFFIFINIFKTNNIKEEINKIFTNNTQILINNKNMKFFSFLKRILLLNLNKFNYHFDITKMNIQKNSILIDNILNVYFNNQARITKVEIFNDQAISNINISNFNFKDNAEDKYNIDFINYNFENNNDYNNALFDNLEKFYIFKNIYSINKMSIILNFHNLQIYNKDINKYYNKYNNYYVKYIIQEKNLQLLMSLFIFYYHKETEDFLRLYSLLFAKNIIVKLNNKIYDIEDFIYRYIKIKDCINQFDFMIDNINVINKKHISILMNISGKYYKTYEYKNTKLPEANNQNIGNKIKLDIKFNEKNRISEYNLISITESVYQELITKDLSGTDLLDTDLSGTDLSGIDLLDTDIEKSISVDNDKLEKIDEDDVFENIFFNIHN